jgi:hypothetical protein
MLHLLATNPTPPPAAGQSDDLLKHFGLAIAGIIIIYLLFKLVKWICQPMRNHGQGLGESVPPPPPKPHHDAPKADFSSAQAAPKPKKGLSLDSVSAPIAPTGTKPQPITPPPSSPVSMQEPSQTPQSTSIGPGDFEKALAQAGQRMDTLLAETRDLTRQLKLAEKARAEAVSGLNQATNSLQEQLSQKDAEITKLTNLLDQKASYPSLRAIIELRKLCRDMVGTQKPLAHDELIDFLTGDIDNKLAALDVQTQDFPVGTRLEDIPGDLIEVSPRHELTEDPAKVNQVALVNRPCYFLQRDSKRIVVAKASVTLYRLQAPSTPSSTPSA